MSEINEITQAFQIKEISREHLDNVLSNIAEISALRKRQGELLQELSIALCLQYLWPEWTKYKSRREGLNLPRGSRLTWRSLIAPSAVALGLPNPHDASAEEYAAARAAAIPEYRRKHTVYVMTFTDDSGQEQRKEIPGIDLPDILFNWAFERAKKRESIW